MGLDPVETLEVAADDCHAVDPGGDVLSVSGVLDAVLEPASACLRKFLGPVFVALVATGIGVRVFDRLDLPCLEREPCLGRAVSKFSPAPPGPPQACKTATIVDRSAFRLAIRATIFYSGVGNDEPWT